nr:hypothetical protein [Sulfitobacter albidus]
MIPLGTSFGSYNHRRYTATRSSFSGGRAHKLVAEALDGSDYISLNLYDLSAGAQLAPCEMPAEKVIAFVLGYAPETPPKKQLAKTVVSDISVFTEIND